ncbi:acetyl-CoA hydrolase/transferase C-terminal domain-containing protein [Paucibacter sp. B51]|uniref:acetyl-CoA hydrolase/transferase C-terminal domain-containing protein n=1 Tax=Paucibacter sp. B51 TaxID=2993315 RepID=UPI0022EBB36E|nr:acetyl-CoA hydrolase/transferase C-terminal domain-containing protein [Paucibacter sp. B51]
MLHRNAPQAPGDDLSAKPQPQHCADLEAAVDEILRRIPGDIGLALPLGIGKPNPLVNALYRRIAALPERRLRIYTALSLEKPKGRSELEQHFLAPLVERVFADYPDLAYVGPLRAGQLPDNIAVQEFFLKTADYLGNEAAQQGFICTNYSFAVRDICAQGVNLLIQAVAARVNPETGEREFSLSCNPDLSFDLLEHQRAAGQPVLTVAMVNEALPFMPGPAVADARLFDLMVEGPGCSHALFAPPNAAISWADYAIGLHASSLVKDGGTLQIGIGSLGDAIAQALIVRDSRNHDYRAILAGLCSGGAAEAPDGWQEGRELGRFEQGLYGCSEMFVNGFMRLIDAGLIRRLVFDDLALQQLALEGRLGAAPDAGVIRALCERGRIASPLRASDLAFLQSQGLLQAGVTLAADGQLLFWQGQTWPNQPEALAPELIGLGWRRAALMHGGFFLGPRDFYQRLRELPEALRQRIAMTRIHYINELYGDVRGSEALKRAQRRDARFINTTMKMTLLGAASSDGYESGQMVSGVGGQYNFVAMAHALPDARSILLLRATHDNAQGLSSSIAWHYANCTIPRHLRDIVVTEYGVADLRGCSDAEVISRLLQVCDSRFQQGLMDEAKAHGKLPADYQLPTAARRNLPETLRERLRPWRNSGVLPDFPFGTDLSDEEMQIVRALKKLKHASHHPVELVKLIVKSLGPQAPVPEAWLERLGLNEAHSFKQLFLRRLFASNL